MRCKTCRAVFLMLEFLTPIICRGQYVKTTYCFR
nr:MAG TPA: hypothetical protein [Caudoviricetes sp.]